MIDSIKSFFHCLLILALIGLCFQAFILMRETGEAIQVSRANVQAVSAEAVSAINAWRKYSYGLQAQLNDPQVRRGVGLLIRSGDDLSRTIKKANSVLDNLNNAIQSTNSNINDRLLPDIRLVVDRTANAVNLETLPELAATARAATTAIEANSTILSASLGSVERSLRAIELRTSDPAYGRIIANLESSTRHADETLNHLERKTKEITRPASLAWRGIREAIVICGRIFLP